MLLGLYFLARNRLRAKYLREQGVEFFFFDFHENNDTICLAGSEGFGPSEPVLAGSLGL